MSFPDAVPSAVEGPPLLATGLLAQLPFEAAGRFFEAGGPLMYANLVTLGVGAVLTVERALVLRLRYDADHRPFLLRIRMLLEAGNRARALQLSAAVHGSPLAELLHSVLARKEGMGSTLDQALADQRPQLEKRIGWLWSLANVAILLGLVGAGLGIVRASAGLQVQGERAAGSRAALLSAGLSDALGHVGFALLVALACGASHFAIRAYARRVTARLERHVRALEVLVSGGRAAAREPTNETPAAAARKEAAGM